jgi:Fe-S cluster biogenesis protein NfuA
MINGEEILMRERVEKVLEGLRSFLQQDGGDVELVDVEDGVVKVKLTGACSGCPGAQMTLTMGIERKLKEEVPEVTQVIAVEA